jgi:glycosyltransferase involved in cell wall biosynthesis
MLRIAVVTSYFPTKEQPYRGHSAYQTLRQLQKWAEIEVYAPFAVYPRWLTPRNFPYFRPDLTYTPSDMRATYFEYPAVPRISRFLNGRVCGRYLLPYLKRSKPDVILNYWLYPDGYAAVLAGKALNIPVVLCAIGSDLCRIPDRTTLRFTKSALAGSTSVLTVSEEMRQRAIGLGIAPEKVQTILNGCDSGIFRLGDRMKARTELKLDQEAKIVLYAGRLDAAKGLRELLAATALVARETPRLQVVFLGEGLLKAELLEQAQKLDLQDRILLPGTANSEGVSRWMTAADLFSLPSYSEGCPNVLVEALACGRPVVATNVGGIPELVTDNCGILIPPRDAMQLAAALSNALSRLWNERAIARQFERSWSEVAKETYGVCLNALPAGKVQTKLATVQ